MLHARHDFLPDETAFREGNAAGLVEIDVMREYVIISEIRFAFRYAILCAQLCPCAFIGRAIGRTVNPVYVQLGRKAAVPLD